MTTPVSARLGEIAERCEAATKFMASSQRRSNVPRNADERLCGWTVPEKVAGLSDGLFAVSGIETLAREDIPYLLSLVAQYREALQALADAADHVGVRFFDTDTMEPEVEAMQAATQQSRAILGPSAVATGDTHERVFDAMDDATRRRLFPQWFGRSCPSLTEQIADLEAALVAALTHVSSAANNPQPEEK